MLVEKAPLILIVDDDPDDIFLLQSALSSKDPSVKIVEAYDGEAALVILQDMIERVELPNLIIIDINMPVMDGRELLSILKSKHETSHIRTVVYTTTANLFDKMHCQSLQTELIVKPSTMDKLNKLAHKLHSWAKEGEITM